MARSLSRTLCLTRHLSALSPPSSSSRLITNRAQSSLPFYHEPTADAAGDSDPLLHKLEDAIHRIVVRRSAPDWLPFMPGASYWVPPPRSRSGLAQLVDKLSNPVTEEENLSTTTVRGWPCSAYFIQGGSPQFLDTVNQSSDNVSKLETVDQSSDNVSESQDSQPMEAADQSSNNASKPQDEEG